MKKSYIANRLILAAFLFLVLTGLIFIGSGQKTKATITPTPNLGLLGSGADIGRANAVKAVGNKAYVATDNLGLAVIDTTNPASMKVLGSQDKPASAASLSINSAGTVAVALGKVYDLADASSPKMAVDLSDLGLTSCGNTSAIYGNYAYVGCGGKDINVVDITTPQAARGISKVSLTAGTITTMATDNGYLFVGAYSSTPDLLIFDLANPLLPRQVGGVAVTPSAYIRGITLANMGSYGRYAFVSDVTKVYSININNPASPVLKNSTSAGAGNTGGVVQGNYFYASTQSATGGGRLYILDISNPDNMTLKKIYGPQDMRWAPLGSAIVNTTLYVAAGDLGLTAMNVADPNNPTEISTLGHQSTANRLVANGALAVMTGTYRGTDIYDVSNPSRPLLKSSIAGSSSGAILEGNLLYLTRAGDLDIYDITNPAAPEFLKTVVTPSIASGVAKLDNFLAVGDAFSGVQFIDVSTPSSASIVGSVALGGLAGEIDAATIGGRKYAFIANSNLGRMQMVDFTNPVAPVKLANEVDTRSTLDVRVSGNYAYVGGNNTLINDPLGHPIKIVDITNPASASIVGRYNASVGTFNARSLFLTGNLLYAAIGPLGIGIVDISNPANPVPAGPGDVAGNYYQPSVGAASDIVVLNNKAYVADSKSEIAIFDTYADKLKVTVTSPSYSVKKNDTVTYTVEATNTSPNTLTNISISDKLNDPLTPLVNYVSSSNGGIYSSSTGKVAWPQIASLAAGAKVTYTVTATVR